jgi:hypothetical protein
MRRVSEPDAEPTGNAGQPPAGDEQHKPGMTLVLGARRKKRPGDAGQKPVPRKAEG